MAFQLNRSTRLKCFCCGNHGHWRADCPFQDSHSMIYAVRWRMKEVSGTPNEATVRVLFEIAVEEDKQYGMNFVMDDDNVV